MARSASQPQPLAAGSSGAKTLPRVGRVLRQLVVVGASAGLYYVAVAWLHARFGQRGFLYALLLLAVVMAFVREFGSDLAEVPARVRDALRRRRAAWAKALDVAADEEQAEAPPPPQVLSRTDAEAEFTRESERLANDEITSEDFQQMMRRLAFVDTHGKFWTIQSDTGKWAFFKDGQWHPGLPLGALSRAQTGNS